MKIEQLNNIFENVFDKSPHVKLQLSRDKQSYTNQFLRFYNKNLRKSIRLSKLIGSPLDNDRWGFNGDDCNITMSSVPVFSERFLETVVVLNADIRGYLSTKPIVKIRTVARFLQDHFLFTDEELFIALYDFNEEKNISINQRQFEYEVFGKQLWDRMF